jgi:hypothetical protein
MVAHQVASMAAATRIQQICTRQGIDVQGIAVQCAVGNLQRRNFKFHRCPYQFCLSLQVTLLNPFETFND